MTASFAGIWRVSGVSYDDDDFKGQLEFFKVRVTARVRRNCPSGQDYSLLRPSQSRLSRIRRFWMSLAKVEESSLLVLCS